MKTGISFHYGNALERAVGENGLTPADINSSAAADAVRAFLGRVTSGEVGFPHLPDDTGTARAIMEFAGATRPGIDDVIVVGIGGSALGAYALDVALRGPHPVQERKLRGPKKQPRLIVMDNVDPGVITTQLEHLDPKRTAVCVVAKSGSTAETLAGFMIVEEWMRKKLGKNARKRIIAVTDAHKGDLLEIAKQEQYPLFFVPENVGGRFSVLTPVGLVPAALMGIDIRKLLRGAASANDICWSEKLSVNLALASAMIHHALDTKRRKTIEVVFAYSAYLWGMAFWYRQLWAESLGKTKNRAGQTVETGQTPIAALGVNDQHSQVQLYIEGPRDKMFTFWTVDKFRTEVKIPKTFQQYDSCGYLGGKKLSDLYHFEQIATETALARAGRPSVRWTMSQIDEVNLGAFLQIQEFQTAFAGELYGIDAFNQPGVELAKKLTYGLMGRKGYEDFAKGLKR